jgi:hypothetical protein
MRYGSKPGRDWGCGPTYQMYQMKLQVDVKTPKYGPERCARVMPQFMWYAVQASGKEQR